MENCPCIDDLWWFTDLPSLKIWKQNVIFQFAKRYQRVKDKNMPDRSCLSLSWSLHFLHRKSTFGVAKPGIWPEKTPVATWVATTNQLQLWSTMLIEDIFFSGVAWPVPLPRRWPSLSSRPKPRWECKTWTDAPRRRAKGGAWMGWSWGYPGNMGHLHVSIGKPSISIGIYSDLMGFRVDLMGFIVDLMGFIMDLMGFIVDLMAF